MNDKTDVHIVCKPSPAILKCARRFFFFYSYLNETEKKKKKKKSTVNSYNLISNNFHAKLNGKQLRNEAKFKLIRKRKNTLTNGHGGMIIHLRATIFKRNRNVQIQALRTVFICLLSLPFYLRFSSLNQTLPKSRCLK